MRLKEFIIKQYPGKATNQTFCWMWLQIRSQWLSKGWKEHADHWDLRSSIFSFVIASQSVICLKVTDYERARLNAASLEFDEWDFQLQKRALADNMDLLCAPEKSLGKSWQP